MRRQLCRAGAVGIAAIVLVSGLAVAATSREKPVVVEAGNLRLTLNGGVTPTTLPKKKFAPLGFYASGSLATRDGAHPPALEEAVFDSDRDVKVDVEGLPSCRYEQLVALDAKRAEAACGDAILGRGSATVRVAFPEQEPFNATGPLVLFNGGERGRAVTLFVYTYVAVPVPTAVVSTATLTTQHKGPYGLHSVIEVPRIAGGAGSFVRGNIRARRVYSYEGERRSVLSGRCPDSRILARGTFHFRDDSQISGSLIRTCTGI